jgi:1-acyl-sn-glycerol-3-phosphate acyltransferase
MRTSQLLKTARAAWRGIVLAASLVEVLLRFTILRLKRGKALNLRDRAEWLHEACVIIVRRLSMGVSVSGSMPTRGLIVSNHLSHLDILLYAAALPCVFVSKSEVLDWPMFGILARCGGTIFVERSRAHGVSHPARRIADALRFGIPVILFPEGTSTDGGSVLPFRSALFEPAIVTKSPIRAAAIGYSVSDGDEADLCYYGQITFFPHLLSVLARKSAQGNIVFGEEVQGIDRKTTAGAAWKAVARMREREIGIPVPGSEDHLGGQQEQAYAIGMGNQRATSSH